MITQPLISIIVPIYKVELYLRQCLDSIVNQTYTNLEVILVDDGSPDGCPQICDEFAAKDKRFVVIHKKNGGLSDARNAGLDICKGDFIYFLDSDDIIPSQCISTLLKIIIQEKAEIVSSSYKEFSDKEPNLVLPNQSTSYITINGSEALILLCRDNTPGIMSSCMKIYKKECFEGIRFPLGKLYEDAHINYKIYHRCKKICYTSAPLYYYRLRKESIMASTTCTIYDLEALENRYLFLKKHNEPAAQYCIEQLCWDFLTASVQHPNFFKDNFISSPRDALKKFKTYASDLPQAHHITLLHKFFLKCFYVFPQLYPFLFKLSPWHIRKPFQRGLKND